MSNQAKRLSDCPAERLSHCRGEVVPPAGDAPKHWPTQAECMQRLGNSFAKMMPPAGGNSYVETRQCDACNHIGINDAASGLGACHDCDWQGTDPVEDKCPGCGNQNCMAAACPKCGARYAMIAEANLAIAVPPAGDVEVQDSAKMEFDKLAHAHVLAICRGAAAACTEQHSYMQGAKTDSKNWFPHKWVIDAIRNLIGINQSTCLTLRDDTTRLQAEVSALQQRLNIADQRVCDQQPELTKARNLISTLEARLLHKDQGIDFRDALISEASEVAYKELPATWLSRASTLCVRQSAPAARVCSHIWVSADNRGVGAGEICQACSEHRPAAKLDASMIGIVHTPPMEYDEP